MEIIDVWIRETNPLLIGFIGSALFALALWIGKKIKDLFLNQFSQYRKWKQSNEIRRILINDYYISSKNFQYFSRGYFILIFNGLRYVFGLIFFSLMVLGLYFIQFPSIYIFLIIYLILVMFIDGISWFSTKNFKSISAYDEVLVDKIKEELKVTAPFEEQDKLRVLRADYGADNITRDISEQLNSNIINDKLVIKITNEIAGDPVKDVPKQLAIEYKYKGKIEFISINEGEILKLPIK